MGWPKTGTKNLRHRHRCRHCGQEFKCREALCCGRRECEYKRCLEKRLNLPIEGQIGIEGVGDKIANKIRGSVKNDLR